MRYFTKIVFYSSLFFTACFPKEDTITPKPRVFQTVKIDAGKTKNKVVFYSLDEAKIVAEASPMDWDLYLDESVIRINYFRSLRVAVTLLDWNQISDTSGLRFSYLTNQEDTLTQWELEENKKYILDLGLDLEYQPMGFVAVQVRRIGDSFEIIQKFLNDTAEKKLTVSEACYYNLRTNQSLDFPMEYEYDVAFGKYTDYVTVDDISQDYLIYGAILGQAKAYALNTAFEPLTRDDFDTKELKSSKDVIGWDWKKFNLTKNAYEIIPNNTYMIATNAQFLCKLRFVNFLNDQGVSGHPTFEFKVL